MRKRFFELLDVRCTELLYWMMGELWPRRPGPFYVFVEDLKMGNRFRVHVLLPPLAPEEIGEVTDRKLAYAINGGELVESEFPATQPEFVFEALQGDVVTVSLYNKDDAANYSPARDANVTITDTIPPAVPGEISFSIEEIADPPPDPE